MMIWGIDLALGKDRSVERIIRFKEVEDGS